MAYCSVQSFNLDRAVFSKIMYLNRPLLLALTSSCLLSVCGVTESALPFGVFPLLTSGWYYKPNPVESVIFGLIVVKVNYSLILLHADAHYLYQVNASSTVIRFLQSG